VLVFGIMLEVTAYLLDLNKVMSNWWFVAATTAIFLGLPLLGRLLMPGAFTSSPPTRDAGTPLLASPVLETRTPLAPSGAASGQMLMGSEGGPISGHS
jgi:hypothetical protein